MSWEIRKHKGDNEEGEESIVVHDRGAFAYGDGEVPEVPGKMTLIDYHGTTDKAMKGRPWFRPGVDHELIRVESERKREPFRRERERRVKRAVDSLSPKQRQALVMLFDLEDTGEHSQADIARALGVSREAVRKRVDLALESLRGMPAMHMLYARDKARRLGILGDW